MYCYKAKVTRVVDGDTLDCQVDLGFKIVVHLRVRLARIDCPEPRSKDADERMRAQDATAFVKKTLRDWNYTVLLRSRKPGSFGRWLAEISRWGDHEEKRETVITRLTLNDMIVAKGLAVYRK